MWQQAEFTTSQRRLRYAHTPRAAAPIALVHGVLRGWQSFLPLSPLAARYELWALDQRGHGASDRAAPDYRVVDYVRDATAWVRDCIGRPVVLYGHSLGAMVVAAVAAELPGLVRGVVLEDPPFQALGDRYRGSAWEDYFRALAALAGKDEPLETIADRLGAVPMRDPQSGRVYRLDELRDAPTLRFFAESLRRVDAGVLDALLAGQWLNGYDQQRVFEAIRCPVMLIQADPALGGMLGDEEVRAAQSQIPKCLHVKLSGAGHMIHWQQTQKIINLVYSFVETLEAV